MLSREIASKQRYRDDLDHGRNCLIVEDPKDHDELTSVLRRTLSEPQFARNLGAAATVLSASIEGEDRYASEWEALLGRHSRGAPAPPSSGLEGFEWVMPDIAAFLRAKHPSLLPGFADDPSEPALGRTIGFLTFAAERLRNMPDAEHGVIVADILDYARERLQASYYPPGDYRSAFGVVDCLQGEVVSLEEAGELRPLHGATASIKTFDHDVTGSSLLDSIGGHDPVGIEDVDLSSLPAGPVTVLFHRSPNLIPCELRIDPETVRLIQFCDGTLSLRELINKMFDEFNVDEPEERSQLADRISAALDRLYRAGVLVFGEWREGWGWTGGERSTSV